VGAAVVTVDVVVVVVTMAVAAVALAVLRRIIAENAACRAPIADFAAFFNSPALCT
jgi:hypothetical protein